MSIAERSAPKASAPRDVEQIYDRIFWLSFIANAALVTANTLTFRFAELVAFLRGSEQMAGLIVSAGGFGALFLRLWLGGAIDRYGSRKLWLLSSFLFLAGGVSFLFLTKISAFIFVARVLFAIGVAGMATCSIVHIQNHVPPHRRTEVIGSFGTSGFLGMILGSVLGDLIFRLLPAGRDQFLGLFASVVTLGLFYFLTVGYLTRGERHVRPAETPAAHKLLFRYWPGSVVLVAMNLGIGLTVTTVFLTRFANELQLGGLRTFFVPYAISAFIFRLASRRWSHWLGRPRLIQYGLVSHCIGLLLLPTVSTDWHLILPALACGFGHALLFPAITSLGAGAFPKEYRGTGTTLTLGFIEIGQMISAPSLGWIIDHYGFVPMFLTAASSALVIGAIFRFTSGQIPDDEMAPAPTSGASAEEETQAVPQLRPALAIVSAPELPSRQHDVHAAREENLSQGAELAITESKTGPEVRPSVPLPVTLPVGKASGTSPGTCSPVPTGTRRDKVVVAARATDPGA